MEILFNVLMCNLMLSHIKSIQSISVPYFSIYVKIMYFASNVYVHEFSFPVCRNILPEPEFSFPVCRNILPESEFSFPVCRNILPESEFSFPVYGDSYIKKRQGIVLLYLVQMYNLGLRPRSVHYVLDTTKHNSLTSTQSALI